MAERKVFVMPAEPGWRLAVYLEEDEKRPAELEYHPIIAWEIDVHTDEDGETWREVIPITANQQDREEWIDPWLAIARPDGRLTVPNELPFDGELQALGYFAKRQRLRKRA